MSATDSDSATVRPHAIGDGVGVLVGVRVGVADVGCGVREGLRVVVAVKSAPPTRGSASAHASSSAGRRMAAPLCRRDTLRGLATRSKTEKAAVTGEEPRSTQLRMQQSYASRAYARRRRSARCRGAGRASRDATPHAYAHE